MDVDALLTEKPFIHAPPSFLKNTKIFINNYESPKHLYEELKQYILGQDDVLQGICNNVWYYLLSILNGVKYFNSYNTMLVGASGSGKTEIYRCLKKLLSNYCIPCTISDTSSITASGYKGREKEEVLIPLISSRGLGIVFLDEFDKILAPSYSRSGTNYSYETQASFLTMIEGDDNIMVTNDDGTSCRVSTMHTMFVCMGAFEGMKRKEKEEKHTLGFVEEKESFDDDEIMHDTIVEDIISFGCRRELIGRFNSIYELHRLTNEHRKILYERILCRYEQALDCKLEIVNDDDESYIIGTENDDTGCRGIERRLKEYMDGIMFDYSFKDKPKFIAIIGKNLYQYMNDEFDYTEMCRYQYNNEIY